MCDVKEDVTRLQNPAQIDMKNECVGDTYSCTSLVPTIPDDAERGECSFRTLRSRAEHNLGVEAFHHHVLTGLRIKRNSFD